MRRLALLLLLLATPAFAQDRRETFEEAFQRCVAAKDPAIVLAASCSAVIDSNRLLPRGLMNALLVRGFAFKTLKRYDNAADDYDEALKIDPDFLPAVSARADLYAARRDYPGAIKEMDRVVAAEPDKADALKRRGDYEDWAGRYDAAIADYTAAFEKTQDAKFLAERGAAYANKRDIPRALADLERAIAEAPDDAVGWFERGRIRFENGDFKGAASDFAEAANRDPADGFRVLWAYLAAARAGDPEATKSLAARAGALDLSDWPGPLIEVFLGRRKPESVNAAEAPEGWERTGRQVEIDFYLAQHDLLAGDDAVATKRLRTARDLDIPEYIETRAAVAELTRLGK
jgi:tetratricopeptide (TPR) repeat protein